jgi:hypothetical protein
MAACYAATLTGLNRDHPGGCRLNLKQLFKELRFETKRFYCDQTTNTWGT